MCISQESKGHLKITVMSTLCKCDLANDTLEKKWRWTGPLGNWHSFCISFIFQMGLFQGLPLPARVPGWQIHLSFQWDLTRLIIVFCWQLAHISLDLCKIMRQGVLPGCKWKVCLGNHLAFSTELTSTVLPYLVMVWSTFFP